MDKENRAPRANRTARRSALVLFLGAALSGFMFLEAALAPKADPWPRWQAFEAASTAVIDHRPWDQFLKKYLKHGPDGVNRVAYGRVTGDDRRALYEYLVALRLTSIERFNRAEQLAYWINLYNAFTVRLMLEFYPVNSIKDIEISSNPLGGIFSGPWDRKLLDVEGEPLSLNDIEHRILRPIWGDPRIHYAVNCAAVGCPNLQPLAFTDANTETLLDHAAQNYVNSPRGARVEDGQLIVSKIYAWFVDDFGGSEEGVLAHLRHLAEPPLARALEGRTSIDDYEYDWGLNDSRS